MRETAMNTIGPALNQRERIKGTQTAIAIFEQMRRAEKNSRAHSLALAPQFSRGSKMGTAKGVYNFLRHGMTYKREPNRLQTAKEIRRFIQDGYGDCKHYATTAVGILNACNIPAWFVLISQRSGSKNPNHAYACCMIGEEIVVIDPCRPTFNSEAIHYHKYNLSPLN